MKYSHNQQAIAFMKARRDTDIERILEDPTGFSDYRKWTSARKRFLYWINRADVGLITYIRAHVVGNEFWDGLAMLPPDPTNMRVNQRLTVCRWK